MQSDLPKTVNEALKILAYNDYFWADHTKLGSTTHIKPHPKDHETVRSLAESQYAWTEKQARLALVGSAGLSTQLNSHSPFKLINRLDATRSLISGDSNGKKLAAGGNFCHSNIVWSK